jgi:membrane protein insertase Oxa1/YidC/SpoIIIJ
MLIQIPVFIGLFYVIRDLAQGDTLSLAGDMYSFLAPYVSSVDVSTIQTTFVGIDLLASNNIILTILAAVLVYGQTRMMQMVKPTSTKPQTLPNGQAMPDMGKMMGMMNLLMPVMM